MPRLLLASLVSLSMTLCASAGLAADAPVDLNWATLEQLERLPGVGKKRAEAIIAHRKARPFKRASELMKVKGFGARMFMRVRPHVVVSAPVPVPEAQALRASADPARRPGEEVRPKP